MKCTFKDSALLKKIINALSKDLTLVNFLFSDDGLKINAMNDSHTDMRDFFLHHTFFGSYACGEPEVLGVNVNLLQKYINTAGPRDVVEWETSSTALKITVRTDNENCCCTEWTLRLVDFEEAALNIPSEVSWDCHVRVGTALFRQWIYKSRLVEGNFSLEIVKDKEINVRVRSDLTDLHLCQPLPTLMANMVASTPVFTTMEKTIASKETDCLDAIIQCAPGVDILYSDEMPMCCVSHLDDNSYIKLWIAPIMGDDE